MKRHGNQLGLGALERFATSFRVDYRFGPVNIMLLLILCLGGLAAHLALHPFELKVVICLLGTALTLALCLRVAQIWEASLLLTPLGALGMYLQSRPDSWVLVTAVAVAGILAPCVQLAYQWEKAVVLRFGKFHGMREKGLFFVVPIIDKVSNFVDQRIRVTDFTAETMSQPCNPSPCLPQAMAPLIHIALAALGLALTMLTYGSLRGIRRRLRNC